MKKYTKAELIVAIAKAHAEHTELVAMLEGGQYSEPVVVGDNVAARYGRGDKTRDVVGSVIAIEGNQVMILSGFDTFKVFTKDVVLASAGQSEQVAPVVPQAQPDTTTQEPKDALAGTEAVPLVGQEKTPEQIHWARVANTQKAVLSPEQYATWLTANPAPGVAA